jgi:hypothetical protein
MEANLTSNELTSVLTKNQKIVTEWKPIKYQGLDCRMRIEIRYDDCCSNGHNSFAITGEIQEKRGNRFVDFTGSCIHDQIAKFYPKYKHLIKWHLMTSDMPMHYIANACYHASNRDHNGRLKGEPSSFDYYLKFENFPLTFKLNREFKNYLEEHDYQDAFRDLAIVEARYNGSGNYNFKPKYSFINHTDDWYKALFDTEAEALEMLEALNSHKWQIIKKPAAFSEGKERDLEAARSCAIWPEATDEQLKSDNLKELLLARLPALRLAFKSDIESLGFIF